MFKTKLDILLKEIKEEIRVKMSSLRREDIKIFSKLDKSIVTEMDMYISELFETKLKALDPNLNFYSEENQKSFKFPMVILDPIDGTKEFASGLDDCVVSFGIYQSDSLDDERNYSWIYNFNTGFEISSDTPKLKRTNLDTDQMRGLVSKTEFELGMYPKSSNIVPVGSIAYKLALLASGECSYVVTKKPKYVWDILAGTHICHKQGISFFSDDNGEFEISEKLYMPNMIWCESLHIDSIKIQI